MTSDSEDLEEQLRQNLKLRRELVAEVTRVRDRNAKDRLGWILYWDIPCTRRVLGVALALDAPWWLLWIAKRWG